MFSGFGGKHVVETTLGDRPDNRAIGPKSKG